MSSPTSAAPPRRRAIIARALVLTGIALSPVAAQAPVSPRDPATLTLGAVLAAAGQQTPRLRAAEAIARAVDARVAGARRPPDPTLQFGFMNYMLPEFAADASLGMRQLQLMQMVPLPGKLAAAGEAAQYRASVARARTEETRWEIRAAATTAFLERWGATEQASIARETRRVLEDAAAIATAMYRVGDGRQADVLRARVEIATMDQMVLRMQAMGESALARLAAVLDHQRDSIDGMPERPVFPDSLPTRESLEEAALAARPMLAAGSATVDAASAELRLATRERWPDLQLGVQYSERGTAMGTDRMGSLMVGATIPLWARARQLRMADEAGAMHAMAAADLAAMRAETQGRVAEAYADLASSRRLGALYRSTVLPQAEAAASSSLAAYRSGAVDFMTVVENRMTINRYRQDLVALVVAEGRAWAELEMLLGRPLLDTGTAPSRGGNR